jgi:hypothetical protein
MRSSLQIAPIPPSTDGATCAVPPDARPGSGQDFMYFVGVIEILAGVVALRDFGLMLAALTLARLASTIPPLNRGPR